MMASRWISAALFVCLLQTIGEHKVDAIDWLERYNVDPRRSALVWTTSFNISQVLCPMSHQITGTGTPVATRVARSDYNIPVDLSVDIRPTEEDLRSLRRKEYRVKSILETVIGDTRIINQDKARLLGEVVGEMVSKCLREAGMAGGNQSSDSFKPTLVEGIVLPLGGAVAKLFLERPPPSENFAERHLDFDLGANTFLRGNSMHTNMLARQLVSQVHWESLARYGTKVLGNTLSREEYLDAVGFATGLTMSIIQEINGTVIKQDIITTSTRYVGNFIKAYLMMTNQYYSFMDQQIGTLSEHIAHYTADDILRMRDSTNAAKNRSDWGKYTTEAMRGLRMLRMISISLLLMYRNGPTEARFQSGDSLAAALPPAWLAHRFLYPAV